MQRLAIVGLAILAIWPMPSASAQTAVEKIYAELAKLPAAERQKRIEDGARKEGKLVIIHTMRGNLSVDHVALFKKRYPFLNVELEGDIGSQDATERLYAEETAGRHLTDVINVALPDLTTLTAKDMMARFRDARRSRRCCRPTRVSSTRRTVGSPGTGASTAFPTIPAWCRRTRCRPAWNDLCNPFFKGSVSFDPAEDRYLVRPLCHLGEQATEELLKCIGDNDPIIQRGHTQRIELMLAGDHMVQGDNYLYHGIVMQRKNPRAPYAIVYSAPVMRLRGRRRHQQEHAATLRRRAVDRLDADRGKPEITWRDCCAGRSRSSIPICPTA